jgi:hypothetical protein
MPSGTRRRFTPTILLSILLVLATGGTALAHYVYDEGETWSNPEKCLQNRTETSHGNGGGFLSVTAELNQDEPFTGICWVPWQRPAGYIRVRANLMRWNTKREEWRLCLSYSWSYNSSSVNEWTAYAYFNTPCGSGYYGTWGYAQVYYNSKWRPADQGPIWSGYHWLPA